MTNSELLERYIKAGADRAQTHTGCMDEEDAIKYAGGVIETYIALGFQLYSEIEAADAVQRAIDAGRAFAERGEFPTPMTPATLAKANTEHSHQRALFAWLNMAASFGFAAAWDEQSYTKSGHAIAHVRAGATTSSAFRAYASARDRQRRAARQDHRWQAEGRRRQTRRARYLPAVAD
jgi:hypothetical protein